MSGIILDELFRSLIHKQGNEKMTNQEAQVFVQWKSQTMRSTVIQGSLASSLMWFATRKLNSFNRLTLTGGAGILTAAWRLRKSVDTCVDHILGMEGTRMQHELKKIILQRYGNDHEKMKLFSKHFYCEEVFNDSTPGRPVPIYRPRNLYTDDNQTSDDKTSREAVKKGVHYQERNADYNSKLKSSGAASKQVPMNSGLGPFGYGDPLDVIFGHSSSGEELLHPGESGNSAKSQIHSQRKARRKHRARLRHQESLSAEVAQHQGA